MHPTPPYLHALAAMATTLLIVTGCKERTYPSYRENPNPKAAIPIRIKVTDAPVEVPIPKVLVQYQIDLLCLPPISNFAGVHLEPKTHWIEYPVQRVSDTEFRSVVFEDGMQVADYYGHGLCSWTMPIVQASFGFSVDGRIVQAATGGMTNDLVAQGTLITYVKKSLAPMLENREPARTSTWSSAGLKNRPDLHREDFFTVDIYTTGNGKSE